MWPQASRCLFLFLAIIVPWVKCSSQVILGILEENKGHYYGDPNYRTVRAVFQKEGNEWLSFRNDCEDKTCLKAITSGYPHEVNWTIAFDGKSLGQVVSRTPSDFRWYSDVGQQVIVSKTPLPTIGVPSTEFGGYTEASVHRPLVANSEMYFADRNRWKPSAPRQDLTVLLQQAFRKRFPQLCRTSNADGKLEQFSYRNDQIQIMKVYASNLGSFVARLHLDAIDCQDTEAGFEIDDPWFFVDTNNATAYLDSGMWLVDAGDYDNDGKSELVFSIDRENEGGYEIWYDNFQKHAAFKFNYH
jgi:hypothetical protein